MPALQWLMPDIVHGSLLWQKTEGYHIHAHCDAYVDSRPCNHSAELDWDVLIARFGPDFVIPHGRPRFMAALKCSVCGSRNISIIMLPPHRPPTYTSRTVW